MKFSIKNHNISFYELQNYIARGFNSEYFYAVLLKRKRSNWLYIQTLNRIEIYH